jgi:hypothetical protein
MGTITKLTAMSMIFSQSVRAESLNRLPQSRAAEIRWFMKKANGHFVLSATKRTKLL